MTDLLLSTKFFIPLTRENIVQRQHLQRKLDQSLTFPLGLITAPPGFGKTTTAADWVRSQQTRLPAQSNYFSWLSLDDEDNDLNRFWTYVFTALQRAGKPDGEQYECKNAPFQDAIALVKSNQVPFQVFLTVFINELVESRTQWVLVLDDYHMIKLQLLHESLTFLIDHAPVNLHLLLVSRTDPPLPLGRWRSWGKLFEIRASDLRFRLAETGQFLSETAKISLNAEEIAELDNRNEGWPAGLQMAAISLQSKTKKEIAEVIASFSGQQRFILDYFSEEILNHQPETIKEFLLKTSVFDRFCADLCAAVLSNGKEDSSQPEEFQEIITFLERSNLFIVPLDSVQRWYRYHPLFGELLRVKYRQSCSMEDEMLLHRRAASWYADQELYMEAVQQALAGKDFEQAAVLLEHPAQTVRLWDGGEVATLLKWIQVFPQDVIQRHVWLQLHQSRSVYFTGQADASEAILEDIEQSVRRNPTMVPDAQLLTGMVLAHRARYASVRGQIKKAEEISQQALDTLPMDAVFARNFVLPTLAHAAFLLGDIGKAANLYHESLQVSQRTGSRFGVVGTQGNLARTLIVQGCLREARQIAEEAIKYGVIQHVCLPVTGWPHFALAEVLYEQNLLDAADQAITEGLKLVAEGKLTDYFGLMPALSGRIKFASGDIEAARNQFEAAHISARKSTVSVFISEVEAWYAWFWLRTGEKGKVLRWVGDFQNKDKEEHLPEIENIILAEILVETGKPEEAVALLERLLEDARIRGRSGREISIRTLLVQGYAALSNEEQMRENLRRALLLGQSENYVRPFLDRGPEMVQWIGTLVRSQETEGIDPDYISRLFKALRVENPSKEKYAEPATPLAETLTQREMEVLRLLAEGLTNREIADRLYLSPNTLRVYTTNLYAKLNVHNRTKAVAQARLLGLI